MKEWRGEEDRIYYDAYAFNIHVAGVSLIPRPSNIFQPYCKKNREGLVDLLT